MIKNRLISTSTRYGLISGAFGILTFFLLLAVGRKPMVSASMFLIDGLLLAVFIWFATKEFKDWNQGELRFWQGMTIGFAEYIITAILFILFLSLYFVVINPEYLAIYKAEAASVLQRSADLYPETFTGDVLAKQLAELDQVTITMLVFSTFLKKVFTGMLVSPVISIILRK